MLDTSFIMFIGTAAAAELYMYCCYAAEWIRLFDAIKKFFLECEHELWHEGGFPKARPAKQTKSG